MLMTTKHNLHLKMGGLTFTFHELCTLININKMLNISFLFSNFSLPQPNTIKFIHNAYDHKTHLKFEIGWHDLPFMSYVPL